MCGSIVKRESKQKDKGKPGSFYYIVYPVNGRQKWETVSAPQGKRFASRGDAESLLAKRINEINGGEFLEQQRITFGAFVDLWMKRYAVGPTA